MGSRATLAKPGDSARVLGSVITRIVGGFEIETKPELADEILQDEFAEGYDNTRPVKMPEERERAPTEEEAELASPRSHAHFRKQVGRFLYFDQHRGDLQHATRRLARKVQAPRRYDMQRLHRLCRYLTGTRNLVLKLTPVGKHLLVDGWGDSDWAGCLETRRSTSGGIVLLNGAAILTYSRLQPTPAMSSCEAELSASTGLACELLYLVEILKGMGLDPRKPLLHTDSQSGMRVAIRQGGGGRLKHLEIKDLAIQQWIACGRLAIQKCAGTRNGADFLTKVPSYEMFVLGLQALRLSARSDHA